MKAPVLASCEDVALWYRRCGRSCGTPLPVYALRRLLLLLHAGCQEVVQKALTLEYRNIDFGSDDSVARG